MNFTSQALPDSVGVNQIPLRAYVVVGAVAVLIWDVLNNVTNDYYELLKTRLTLSTAAYFGSRLGTLGYAIGSAIFETAPSGNCVHSETIIDIFYPIALGCSTLLFFFRLQAIYNRNPIVVGCFFVLWLGLLACTSLILISVRGGTLGTTEFCEDVDIHITFYLSIIAPAVYDTLVFMAISWRLFRNAHVDVGFKEGIRIIFSGKFLPAFSKGLLHDTQRYYLITFMSNLATVVSALSISGVVSLRSIWIIPNTVLTNIMACAVYRRTKAGISRESEIPISTGIRVSNPLPVTLPSKNKTLEAPYHVDVELSEFPDNIQTRPIIHIQPLNKYSGSIGSSENQIND